jgi:hypothetical protein
VAEDDGTIAARSIRTGRIADGMPPVDIRPPEVGAGDGGKGLDGSTGGLEKFPA